MSTVTHGLYLNDDTKRLYHIWYDIKDRCYNTQRACFDSYGARGIHLQPSWENDVESFVRYALSLPKYSKSRTLDRVDNDKGYEEGNLRWATSAEQMRNRRKYTNNTSGVCGVSWGRSPNGTLLALASWKEGDKRRTKPFLTSMHGLLPAFAMACRHREKMIEQLNKQGAGYSDKHGK